MVQRKGVGYWVFTICNTIFMTCIALICLLPMVHVLFASFSEPTWVLNKTGLILWPHEASLEGYRLVFQNQQLMRSYLNTFIYVFSATGIGLLVTVLGAYTLSRKDALFANPIMMFVTFTMLFNGGLIPFYLVVTGLGLFDSMWSVILPTCVSAFNLILVRTAMLSIPPSLEESAKLDGAGPMRILFSIVLPLVKATIATVILYYAVAHWNAWFNASIFLRSRSKFPLQLILREILISNDVTSISSSGEMASVADTYKQLLKYCTIIVSTVPVLIFYPFIMKYFKSGVMIGSLKG